MQSVSTSLSTLRQSSRTNKLIAAGVAIMVVIIGYLFIASHAAGFVVSVEPENGTKTANASVVTDATASGSKAVQFNAPAPAPPPPPPPPPPGGSTCPAYPAFPDASCTGYKHTGVTLQVHNGDLTIEQNNTVIDSMDIHGCVNVYAFNVTIKRSRVACESYYAIRNFKKEGNVETTYTGLKVTDVEIDGLNDLGGSAGIAFAGYTALRVDAHNLSSIGFHVEDNTTIEDSYVHDFPCGLAAGTNMILHQAGAGTNGGGSHMIIRHNNFDLKPVLFNGEGCASGAIANYHDFGTFDDMLIEKNLMNTGGQYCLKAGVEQTGKPYPNSTNVRVLNNVFGTKYNPLCGEAQPQGLVSNWANGPTNVWSGNTLGSPTGPPVNP
jgi:hypothetical protein